MHDTPDSDELVDDLDEQIRLLAENSGRIARIQGRAQTRDGMVQVRVNSAGQLVDLTLSAATATVSREWLGRTIVELTREATAHVADQIDRYHAGFRAARHRLVEQIAVDAPTDAERLRRVSDSVTRPARPPQPPPEEDFSQPHTWLQRP